MVGIRTRWVAAASVVVLALAGAGCGPRKPDPKGVAAADAATQIERGRYLVAVMDCGGCHTPGALVGAPKENLALAGSDVGFEVPGMGVVYPPNLTSHPATSISQWSAAEVKSVIRTGERPDERMLMVMPWRAYANLSDSDADAVAAYLKSLAPIENAVPGPSPVERRPCPI